MKKIKKLILGILIIVLITIICALMAIKVGNKNIIQKQSKEAEKLAETNQDNSYITTEDHLAEVNSSVQSIWESIRNSEVLSGRTDSSGNSIYGNVTDIESLESAISTDTANSVQSGQRISTNTKVKSNGKYVAEVAGIYCARGTADGEGGVQKYTISTNGTTAINSTYTWSPGNNKYIAVACWVGYLEVGQYISITGGNGGGSIHYLH